MFGKSAAQINVRRDVKRRVVELLVACGETGANVIRGNGILQPEQTGVITVRVREFIFGLTEDEKAALRTGKGCTTVPPGLKEHVRVQPLLSFLNIPVTGRVQDVGCMAGFVGDGLVWARQVADANRNSHIAWPILQARLDAAAETVQMGKKQYFANPSQREPQDYDEAWYWLHYHAYNIADTVPVEAARQPAWRAKFQQLREHLRNNPNLQGLSVAGYNAAYARAEDWYLNGNVPPEVR